MAHSIINLPYFLFMQKNIDGHKYKSDWPVDPYIKLMECFLRRKGDVTKDAQSH